MAGDLHLKANSRGSWASVCSFEPDQIERVKDGCRLIALAARLLGTASALHQPDVGEGA